MINVDQLKTELREFIAAAEEIKGYWKVWPTHWAGGSNSVKVDGANTIWVDSDRGDEVCRFRTDNGCVTQSMYNRAGFIARSRNMSPVMAQCLLELVVAYENNTQLVRDEGDVALALAMEGQLRTILTTWEKSK